MIVVAGGGDHSSDVSFCFFAFILHNNTNTINRKNGAGVAESAVIIFCERLVMVVAVVVMDVL